MEWPSLYVGLPYAERGRARPAVDCWGLVRLVVREQAGVELPLWDGIDGRDLAQCNDVIARDTAETWTRVDEDTARAFDLVVMRGVYRGSDARLHGGEIHCGVLAPGGRVLHVERGNDTVCVPIARLRKRITGIFRHRNL